ncbi:monooxygenase FAD-binding protein [Streptomyces sp. CBMAI 2042]|uniref:FAD-dependent oxidoreductase n=1 Tax=Streptomyces sp. CBMAI 2042 TaxID=2305222 RepID=UPI000F23B904|nr:FAD-dependent oxidoreductase [Streptomyces sp. CBMAI 2042]RLV68798.1 monooxygenase FAD-binding protein [Streptomyces sp. CBMAI 2042]
MTDDVLIVGAGPTGLTLALDLARRGAAVRIVDKSPAHPRTSRAKGPNPRSLEILADLGVADEVLAAGSAPLPMRVYRDHRPVAETDPWADAAPTPAARFDRPWLLAQWRLEEILRARLAGHGVRVELGREVVGLVEGAGGQHVDVTFAEGRAERARYVVGCDGAHSPVRKLLGITFEGTTANDQVMVSGDVELDHEELGRDRWHQWFDEDGAVMLCPIPGTRTGWWFQAGPERDADGRPLAPTLDGFRRLLTRHTGLPGRHLTRAELLSTYRVNVRMADRYRVGRVLLAGDAAHVHAIAGGLGMNTGIQDAFNLGWKLGQVLAGQADAGLLDTYEEERLPVAAWTLDLTSDRLRATLEAIREPGGNLGSAMTPETAGLGIGYRWSSLADAGAGAGANAEAEAATAAGTDAATEADTATSAPRPGDRAPDAPCRDAATGERTHLYGIFAGPHTTVLGFGPASAAVLREVAATYGEGPGVRACRVYAADEDHGTAEPGPLVDDQGHAAAAYGIGAGGSGLVVIRPDHHVGIVAPAGDPGSVREYLRRLHGAPGMVDAVR